VRSPILAFLLVLVVAFSFAACTADDEPDVTTISSELVAATIQSSSPAPPVFEKMQSLQPGDATAQLNFEMRLTNTGTEPMIVDRATLAYTGATTVAPTVARADLRRFYLGACTRAGFGLDKSGALALDLPGYAPEEISDIDTPSVNSYATVRARKNDVFPGWGALTVDRFVAIKLKNGNELEWTTEVPFEGYEDRANAMTKADGNKSYIAVGATHPINTQPGATDPSSRPWSFAAVQLDSYGAVVTRADATPWKTTVPFPFGCSAEAIDVARVTLNGSAVGYFLAGNATCGGNSQVAMAMLDVDGRPVLAWGGGGTGTKLVDPGALPAKVGGVAVDPTTNDLYIVGTYGEDLMVINLSNAGVLDAGFAPGGVKLVNPPLHDKVVGMDAQVMSDGRIAIAGSGRRIATAAQQILFARLTSGGAVDPILGGGAGFVAVSVPGMSHSFGRAIEIHEGETWFTVSGFADQGTKRIMIAAAFSPTGAMRTQFDADGFLVMGPGSPASGFRTSLRGDFITLGGATGSILGGARFHRKDGTPDDTTVVGVGESCALLWPDTGVRPPGATHLFNVWDVGALPTTASVTLRLTPFPAGTAVTKAWSTPLSLFDDGGWKFPGDPPAEPQTYWHVNQSHSIVEGHRHAYNFSTVTNQYINLERYAYDLSPMRWTDAGWNGVRIGGDPKTNEGSLSWGRDVHPLGPGEIVRCGSGVRENKAPGAHDVELECNANAVPCFYDGGGNQFWVRHPDGTVSFYAHLQDGLDPELCPFVDEVGVLPTPVPVTLHTVLGKIGNSGHSAGPHLHVEIFVPWDASDPTKSQWDYADGRPLMFKNVRGIPRSVPFDEWPELQLPYPVAAQYNDVMLRMTGPNDPYPDGPTGCDTVNPNGSPSEEWTQADGNAGPDTYCIDDGADRVCVDNGDGSSDCQTCGIELGEMYPGCPCSTDEQCGGDMICWGMDVANSEGVDNPGRCFPWDELPAWACAYDCKANRGANGWCYNDFASLTGRARCMDQLTDRIEAEMCWEYGYDASSGCPDPEENVTQSCVETCICTEHGGDWDALDTCEDQCDPSTQPSYDGECVVECLFDVDCQADWGYPSEYQCDNDVGVPVCRIPW
jgi:hypothetical protein